MAAHSFEALQASEVRLVLAKELQKERFWTAFDKNIHYYKCDSSIRL